MVEFIQLYLLPLNSLIADRLLVLSIFSQIEKKKKKNENSNTMAEAVILINHYFNSKFY